MIDLPARPIPKPDDPEESKRVTKAVREIDPDIFAVKELYTLEEIAVILSMGLSTVERMVREGYLASGKVPGTESARRVSRMQLAAFIAAFDAQHGTTREYRLGPRPRRR